MMNRNADHLAAEHYQDLEELLVDLVTVGLELKCTGVEELLISTDDIQFIGARLMFLARGALDHVKDLKVIPHQTISDPGKRHLRAVEGS